MTLKKTLTGEEIKKDFFGIQLTFNHWLLDIPLGYLIPAALLAMKAVVDADSQSPRPKLMARLVGPHLRCALALSEGNYQFKDFGNIA